MIPTLPSRLGTKLILSLMAFVKAWSYTPDMAQPVQREAHWAIIPVLGMILSLTELTIHSLLGHSLFLVKLWFSSPVALSLPSSFASLGLQRTVASQGQA